MFVAETVLRPVAPFSFDLSAKIFGDGDPQIRIYRDGIFKQVVRAGKNLALLTLESAGTVDKPTLKAELKSNHEMTHTDVEQAARTAFLLFNLDLDLAPFYSVSKKDVTLNKIVQRLRGMRSPATQTVYEALVDSIVEQQISLRVATSIERRVIKSFGEKLTLDDEDYHAYPTPTALAQTSIEELKACGLSGRKAEYIREVSALIKDGKLDLERFRNYQKAEDIVRELDAVRGIGTWTAELTVIRALQKWDVMPADDIGLRRILARFYCGGKRISSAEARKIADPWGKWMGLAAFYFVVAEMLELEV